MVHAPGLYDAVMKYGIFLNLSVSAQSVYGQGNPWLLQFASVSKCSIHKQFALRLRNEKEATCLAIAERKVNVCHANYPCARGACQPAFALYSRCRPAIYCDTTYSPRHRNIACRFANLILVGICFTPSRQFHIGERLVASAVGFMRRGTTLSVLYCP